MGYLIAITIIFVLITIVCTWIVTDGLNDELLDMKHKLYGCIGIWCIYIIIFAAFLIAFKYGVNDIERNARLDGVREYAEKQEYFKVRRVHTPDKIEISYNDSIKE